MNEYKWIKIVPQTKQLWALYAQFVRRTNEIYTYPIFELLSEVNKIWVLQHEFCHITYNTFTQEDVEFWKTISTKEPLYVSGYAKDMSKFLKWPQEEFCECWKILEQEKILKKDIKFNDYRDVKLLVAKYLYDKYNKTV